MLKNKAIVNQQLYFAAKPRRHVGSTFGTSIRTLQNRHKKSREKNPCITLFNTFSPLRKRSLQKVKNNMARPVNYVGHILKQVRHILNYVRHIFLPLLKPSRKCRQKKPPAGKTFHSAANTPRKNSPAAQNEAVRFVRFMPFTIFVTTQNQRP